ncbi:oxidoreductase [Bacillus siamensis]|uniref:Short-chain dehydrogenase n=1 Tax=Bacillus siamensis TaxID=659243 RepID=A0AAI8HLB1_9BACI|nr:MULTISPECIES: oxidoreductase [Bacillus]AME07477.1 short-chain dehydrogenase [Bacillus sp. SDLI1]AUJ76059.1 short-chain dehydrogenase [Bacillus siamensis]UUA83572.1 oxidoreductase [Bacillus siamensis]
MNRKVAIVTGATSGFGLLTALKLARSYHVIATARQPEKAETLKEAAAQAGVSGHITIASLDVTNEQSVSDFGNTISGFGPVDVLVNNAGTAYGGFIADVPMEHYRQQFDTNVFGLIHVTKTVLPYMRKHGGAKIINISSISGLTAFPALSPYTSSKFAIEGFTECLRLELLPLGIDAALIEPGSYKTSIWETSLSHHLTAPGKDSPYYRYYQQIEAYFKASASKSGDPNDVAELIYQLAQTKCLKKLRYPIGRGIKLTLACRSLFSWPVWESVIKKKLFKET